MAGWTSVRACQRRVRLVPPPQPDGMDKLRPLLGLEAQVILASTVREFRVKGLGIMHGSGAHGKIPYELPYPAFAVLTQAARTAAAARLVHCEFR